MYYIKSITGIQPPRLSQLRAAGVISSVVSDATDTTDETTGVALANPESENIMPTVNTRVAIFLVKEQQLLQVFTSITFIQNYVNITRVIMCVNFYS